MDETKDLGCLPNGSHIYRKDNAAGGHTYYSDEVGGGIVIWDTCLLAESTLLTAMACEHHRKYTEYLNNRTDGWKQNKEMALEVMAATGGSFYDADTSDMDDIDDDLKILAIECYLAYENKESTNNIEEKTVEQFDKCDIGWKRDWVRVAQKCSHRNNQDG